LPIGHSKIACSCDVIGVALAGRFLFDKVPQGRSSIAPRRNQMTNSDLQQGPTVVLVHGAFADAGSWAAVTERLVSAGGPVMAIVNPLRGIKHDAAYVASAICGPADRQCGWPGLRRRVRIRRGREARGHHRPVP
jgi:hypothetical protein